MPIFTEENAKCILCELKKKIQGSMGVKNAIRQGSVGFENWVQIEMSGILKEYINGDRIAIEKAHDICIYDNRNVPKVVIEIKIIKNSERDIPAIKRDIDKLKNFEPNNVAMERAFFCVLYKSNGRITCQDTLNRISVYIEQQEAQIIVQKEFYVNNNAVEHIEVVLYLNRWGGIVA